MTSGLASTQPTGLHVFLQVQLERRLRLDTSCKPVSLAALLLALHDVVSLWLAAEPVSIKPAKWLFSLAPMSTSTAGLLGAR